LFSVSSFIFLQTSLVCPVFESITVFPGTQLQVTVLAFSCALTTQCSMTSALAGGIWLRMGGGVGGGGVAATGGFFAAHPVSSRHNTSQPFSHASCFRSVPRLSMAILITGRAFAHLRGREGRPGSTMWGAIGSKAWFVGGGGGSRTRVRKCYWSRDYMLIPVHAPGVGHHCWRFPQDVRGCALRTDKKR
jgi:hypothetical protein